jgi:hypothetical protein
LDVDAGISQNMTSHTKIHFDVNVTRQKNKHLRKDQQNHRALNTYVKSYGKKLSLNEDQNSTIPQHAKDAMIDLFELKK